MKDHRDEVPYQEVSRETFIMAEREAGFYPKHGCGDIATGSFSSTRDTTVEGIVTHDGSDPNTRATA
jgi:hypothetical protein